MTFTYFRKRYLTQTSAEKILLTTWVGALWAIGFLAVPILFASLDRQLAGMLAGKMFTGVSYLGLFCGWLLLIAIVIRSERLKTDSGFWLLLVMLLLVVVGEFILQPQMAELKQIGLLAGSPAAHKFDQLHHIATALYLFNSFLGLVLIMSHSSNSSAARQP